MPLTTVAVTGTIGKAIGSTHTSGVIRFQLDRFDVDTSDGQVITADANDANVSASGEISINLWPNDRGAFASRYNVYHLGETASGDFTNFLGKISIPESGAPHDFDDLLASGEPTPEAVYIGIITQEQYDAIINAEQTVVNWSFENTKSPVDLATTANITLSGEQSIDGTTTSTSRVLVKDQTDASENGIYVTASGAWSRATDMDADSEVDGARAYVLGGSSNGGKTFISNVANITIGTDDIPWVQLNDNSGVQDQIDGLDDAWRDFENNLFPASAIYPPTLDVVGSSDIVAIGAVISDLYERGHRYGVEWTDSSQYVRYSSGTDLDGQYIFAAMLVYSDDADSIHYGQALVKSEASDLSRTDLSGATGGEVVLSSTAKLVWLTGQVNNEGDQNILVGFPAITGALTRYMTGLTLHVGTSALDPTKCVRQMLLADQLRRHFLDGAEGIDPTVYTDLENALTYGDYFGGEPELRSSSPTVGVLQGSPLYSRGYRRAALFASASPSDYFRYEHGADLTGKYVYAGFLAWSADPSHVPLDPNGLTEKTDGTLDGLVGDATLAEEQIDLGNNLYMHTGYYLVDSPAGFENFLIGSNDNYEDVYATGAFIYVSDEPIDRAAALEAFYYRETVMQDVLRRTSGVTAAGEARLVLSGSGEVESYVESSKSGSTIKRTFVAFPTYQIDAKPVCFNFTADYVEGVKVREGDDDVAPDYALDYILGANHGWKLGELTAAGHGKVEADQGSIWSTGGVEYLLVYVKDSDTLLMTRRSGNGDIPTGTYTHVSGATNTGDITVTAESQGQWYPPFENRDLSLFVDGEKITDQSGVFSYRDTVQFVETYDVLDKSEIVTWWEANGSSGSILPDGDPSYRVTITYEYDRDGQLTIYRDFLALKSMSFTTFWGLQAVRDDMTDYYVPKATEFTHDGDTVNYSLIEAADRTSTGGGVDVLFTPSNCEGTGILADRLIALKDSDHGFAIGYLPVSSTGVSQRRTEITETAIRIRGNSDKVDVFAVNKGEITLSAGDCFSTIAYRHVFPQTADRTDSYVVRTRGDDYVYADWHDVVKVDRIALPPDLAGRSFEEVESRNCTVLSQTLTGHLSVDVDASGDYAFLILKVTK